VIERVRSIENTRIKEQWFENFFKFFGSYAYGENIVLFETITLQDRF
jgi:hypothetical protein